MALLNKLKSLLGLDEGRSGGDQREDDTVGVTVEHDRSDDREPAPESGAEEPPIASTTESEPDDSASTETDTEGSIDEESAADPEEAPPGTDAPGTEMAEPESAETGESSEDGAGVDGTVDVEPDVESPDPESDVHGEGEADSEPSPASDQDSTSESEPEIRDSTTDDDGGEETLQDLKGIGPSYETQLSEAGVETVDDLADADADELSDETGLSSKRLQRWIDRASRR